MSSISKIKLPNNTTYDINAATVNGHTVATDVPSGAVFTDTKVTQSPATDNANYEVLFSGSADNTAHTEGAKKSAFLKYNPSSHKLYLEEESTSGGLMTITTTSMGTSYLKAEESIFSEVSAGEYALSSNSYIEVAGSDIFHSNTWDGSHYYLKDAIYNVKQSPNDSTDAEYRILFSNTADDTERIEKVQKDSDITYNPLKSSLKIGMSFSSGGVTGSRDTTIDTRGIKISEYVGSSLYGQLELQYRDIFLDATWDGTNTSLKNTITYLGSQSAANKVDKSGDTMSGQLQFTKNDGADIIIPARTISYIAGNQGNAGIYAKKDLNATQWYPILCMDTKSGGSWAIGNYNDENLQFSYATKANRDSGTNTTSLVILRNTAGTIALTSELTWNTISGKPSTFTPSSHNHGLLHDNFTVTLANTTTDSGWSMINSTYNGFLLKSIRFNGSSPGWGVGNYGAGICFGGGDTKGILSCAYGSPSIKIAGGNGTKPQWWIGISGTSGTSYNLANLMPLSGDSIKSGHLQLGSGNKVYILRTALIARHDTGDSGYVNIVTYTNSAYSPIRASGFTTMSCKHVKTNIEDISDEDAKKLLNLRPVNFDYVEEVGGQKDQIGVLAEDTYKILPKVVSVPDDYVEENFDITKGIQQPLPSVDYAKFTPYLIKMVQIQQREIDSLKKIIEGRNDL